MKLHRSLAIAATTAVASVALLSTAPSAFAATVNLSAPAIGRPAAMPEQHMRFDFKTSNPRVVVGGEPTELQLTITNSTDHGALFPVFVNAGKTDDTLFAPQERIQFNDGQQWSDAVVLAALKDKPAPLEVLGAFDANGMVTEDSLIYLAKGESITIPLKLSVHGDVKPGAGFMSAMAPTYAIDDATGDLVDPNESAVVNGGGLGLTFVAPSAPSSGASSTATQTPSGTPSAPASTPASHPASAPASTPASHTASAPASTPASHTAPASSSAAAPAPGQSTAPIVPAADTTTVTSKVTTPNHATVQTAKSKTSARSGKLASTGGGDHSTAIAVTGAAAVAIGAGTLVLLRRRKANTQA